ncbi:MAG: methylenetetrahydrofolate reductase [NAD(P)H] [Acidobacteriota bacterium]
MGFADFYRRHRPVISFELFPPKTERGLRQLERRLPKLIALHPAFISVTYGALGSTRERTLDITSRIQHEFGQVAAHHITCVGSTREEIRRNLEKISLSGIDNIVALRGDPPQGQKEFRVHEGGYPHASDLVRDIRARGEFDIAVAGYPEKHVEAPDFETDLRHLKTKVDAGADLVITQLFYDNRHYYHFVEKCRAIGITVPIVPGLLPILSLSQVERITGMCGSTIPPRLLNALRQAETDERRVELGIAHITGQAVELLKNKAPGIHFYVLNRYFHIAEIMGRIRGRIREGEEEPSRPGGKRSSLSAAKSSG